MASRSLDIRGFAHECRMLIVEAEALGFERSRRIKHGMLMKFAPTGHTFSVPTTPSDGRSVKNSRADMLRIIRLNQPKEEPAVSEQPSAPTNGAKLRPYPIEKRGVLDHIAWVVSGAPDQDWALDGIVQVIQALGPEHAALLKEGRKSIMNSLTSEKYQTHRRDLPSMFIRNRSTDSIRWSGAYERHPLDLPGVPKRVIKKASKTAEAVVAPAPEPVEPASAVEPLAEMPLPVVTKITELPAPPAVADRLGITGYTDTFLIEIVGTGFDGSMLGRDEAGRLFYVKLEELK